jgi:hypothetical protein
MRFNILIAVITKIIFVWDMTPCNLVDTDVSDESTVSIFRLGEKAESKRQQVAAS